MRDGLKRFAEKMLVGATSGIERRKGAGIILAYHNVVPNRETARGDRSLHIRFDEYRRHLDGIQRHCRPMSLLELLANRSETDLPRVALTFDDAYRGAVELGIPEAASRGLTCTLFVAPGLLGARSFWWDDIAEQLGGLPDRTRTHLLQAHSGQDAPIRAEMLRDGTSPALPPSYACAEESQLDGLSELPTVAFGSHSWSHPNLAGLDRQSLETELALPLAWLQSKPWRTIQFLAYPFGLYSEEVEQAARNAGYEGCLAVTGGWLPPGPPAWSVPRLNIPASLSVEGLLLRLRGVFPTSGPA